MMMFLCLPLPLPLPLSLAGPRSLQEVVERGGGFGRGRCSWDGPEPALGHRANRVDEYGEPRVPVLFLIERGKEREIGLDELMVAGCFWALGRGLCDPPKVPDDVVFAKLDHGRDFGVRHVGQRELLDRKYVGEDGLAGGCILIRD